MTFKITQELSLRRTLGFSVSLLKRKAIIVAGKTRLVFINQDIRGTTKARLRLGIWNTIHRHRKDWNYHISKRVTAAILDEQKNGWKFDLTEKCRGFRHEFYRRICKIRTTWKLTQGESTLDEFA